MFQGQLGDFSNLRLNMVIATDIFPVDLRDLNYELLDLRRFIVFENGLDG
jgi:hypothetical protein